ncbi:MAG: ABC transporter permease [Cyclobacteriaceae bacterium]|nr:ABC transporter permease [Cyclobacteriaceae bacterium]
MYTKYFLMAWRSLLKNRVLSAINVVGLAVGIASCLIILLFVVDELRYDRYTPNADRIVRVVLKGKVNGEIIKEAVTPAPVGPTLKSEFPEVVEATRIRRFGTPKIAYQNTTYRNDKLAFVDPSFFRVFALPFLQGDPATALADPHTVVLTRSAATKYFGTEDPLNKLLEFKDSGESYRVTAVIEDIPAHSHFHFDLFASLAGIPEARENNWMASNYHTYLLLNEAADGRELEAKLPDIVAKYMGPQVEQLGMTFEKFKANGNEVGLFLQPLTAIHLLSDIACPSELEPGGDVKSVYIFAAIAVFMLLIACINFMNLSTAGATKRNKEVGVKKVMGSQRAQLVGQFLTESLISTALAMLIALALVMVALPLFNQLSGKRLDSAFLLTPGILIAILLLVIVVTLLAGAYPAFYLSSIRPISALRGKATSGRETKGIRSALVVFQFVVSAGLILSIVVVDEQLTFIRDKEIGYNRENLVVLRESYLLGSREQAFRNQLLNDPRIAGVTRSAFVPAGPTNNSMAGMYPGQQQESIYRTIVYHVDAAYLPTMGMRLVAGRNFADEPRLDSLHVLINETAARTFGIADNPLGQLLTESATQRSFTVIGVVKDFHFRSMHEAIAPMMMVNNPHGGLILRTTTTDLPGLLADLEKQWKTFHVEEPFSYALLDDLYNETYLAEAKMGNIMELFGALTIVVACLGLFGLVTFAAEQRVKEIGIRKVLGANVGEVVSLLSRDLVVLVLISFCIAFPLGYYLMDQWLQAFAYKTEVQWWMFVLAGMATLVIALVTMSFKTIRSALANPVDALRSE